MLPGKQTKNSEDGVGSAKYTRNVRTVKSSRATPACQRQSGTGAKSRRRPRLNPLGGRCGVRPHSQGIMSFMSGRKSRRGSLS